MKLLNFLVAISIVNLGGVAVIASTSPSNRIEANVIAPIITPAPRPTPIVRVKKVVKKVFVASSTKPVLNTTSSNISLTTSNSPSSTVTQNPTVSTPTPPPVSNRCIITIDGVSYDITDFRAQHSGGDVFSCGSDMSATFWGRHGNSQLRYLERFRV